MNAHVQPPQGQVKLLFRVFKEGRQLVGSFSSKWHAVKARDQYNKTLKPGERRAWIGPGPDHWRALQDDAVPMRWDEVVWIKKFGHDLPVKQYVKPAEFWLG